MWCRITIHQPRILPTTILTGAVIRSSDEEAAALVNELTAIVKNDHFPFSGRVPVPAEALRAAPSQRIQTALRSLKSKPAPPMTLGNAARSVVRLIVWCKDCQHRDLCAITASPASTGEFALRFVDDSPLEEAGFELLVPP